MKPELLNMIRDMRAFLSRVHCSFQEQHLNGCAKRQENHLKRVIVHTHIHEMFALFNSHDILLFPLVFKVIDDDNDDNMECSAKRKNKQCRVKINFFFPETNKENLIITKNYCNSKSVFSNINVHLSMNGAYNWIFTIVLKKIDYRQTAAFE